MTAAELEASGFEWACDWFVFVGYLTEGTGVVALIYFVLAFTAVGWILRSNSPARSAQATGEENTVGLLPSLSGGQSRYNLLSGFQGAESHEVIRRCRIVVQLVVFFCVMSVVVAIMYVLVHVVAFEKFADECEEVGNYGIRLIGPICNVFIISIYSGVMAYVAVTGVKTRNERCCDCCDSCGPRYGHLTAFYQWAIVGAVFAGLDTAFQLLQFTVFSSPGSNPMNAFVSFISLVLISLCAHHAQQLLAAIAVLPSTDGTLELAPVVQGAVIVGKLPSVPSADA